MLSETMGLINGIKGVKLFFVIGNCDVSESITRFGPESHRSNLKETNALTTLN